MTVVTELVDEAFTALEDTDGDPINREALEPILERAYGLLSGENAEEVAERLLDGYKLDASAAAEVEVATDDAAWDRFGVVPLPETDSDVVALAFEGPVIDALVAEHARNLVSEDVYKRLTAAWRKVA